MDLSTKIQGGDYARANRLLSASAGTAIPGILAAQRSGLRREMTFIRTRAETMGLNPDYIQGDLPQVNGWIEANGCLLYTSIPSPACRKSCAAP